MSGNLFWICNVGCKGDTPVFSRHLDIQADVSSNVLTTCEEANADDLCVNWRVHQFYLGPDRQHDNALHAHDLTVALAVEGDRRDVGWLSP